tara:strand:+ start:3788 stop:4789 length:1002 start_codon:yes stop_codon:yes gene_type:complete
MAYNRVGTPKFYIDAMLLARQWGEIATENSDGLHYLNPSKIKPLTLDVSLADYVSIVFNNRYWTNSLTHLFVLGHNFHTESITFSYRSRDLTASYVTDAYLLGDTTTTNNGWNLYSLNQSTDKDNKRTTFKIKNLSATQGDVVSLCELSAGWSWTAPHSPDLELTLNFSNESIKTQTTKGGHTLSNAGYNQQPSWIRQPWTGTEQATTSEDRMIAPTGRRSWNLKFSYLSDNDATSPLFPQTYNSENGIFTWLGGDDPNTPNVEEPSMYDIKKDFMSKVYHGTNGFMLPLIFCPDSGATTPEYAICRINSDTASFNQVANNVYDISLDITEVW